MKRISLVLLFCILSIAAFAQANGTVTRSFRLALNEKTVVKDTTGAVLPYADWQNLLHTGEYSFRSEKSGDSTTAMVIYKMNAAQRQLMLEHMPPPRPSQYFTTGQPIESFSGNDLKGKRVNLDKLRGKVVVINFWFINCSPCRQEIPELNKLVSTYADNPDVVFIAVCLDDWKNIRAFTKDNPFNYQIVTDGRDISSKYGITSYPTNLVLDKTGAVRFHSTGYGINTPPYLKKAIEESLQGEGN